MVLTAASLRVETAIGTMRYALQAPVDLNRLSALVRLGSAANDAQRLY